ncbi:hypothetical protein SAMN05428961_103577 [Paenibacillus sp. OK060]|uniref:hypothetical protein n=1 Tax=Paenibacillus sp. OK060 TaxID=1881034 RepID=UPI0008903C48|nr:hypothetical protein [Paenibacillus sp. OK060]SDL01698.1 hypothetical protein SAMN05428961_103577 [Paenibacillus sp. OK060]
MDRLKHSGFYKLKFFITPDEFKSLLALFEQKRAKFIRPSYDQTQYDTNQVLEGYEQFYHFFTAAEKREGYHPYLAYSVLITLDQHNSGFFVKNEGINFPYDGQWAEDELPCITLSLPKGFQINLEDEKGRYYIYEDIREHLPLTYAFYEEVASGVKKITKLLRFSAPGVDAMQEQKPSVRVSQRAVNELKDSWIFNKYSLVMNTK